MNVDTRFEEHALQGQTIVTGTAPTTGHFTGMLVIADAVVAAVTYETSYEITGTWTSLTSIPAGLYLPGRFSSITLTSGEVVLIHRKRTP